MDDKELLRQLGAKIAKDTLKTRRHHDTALIVAHCITIAGLIAMAALVWEKVNG